MLLTYVKEVTYSTCGLDSAHYYTYSHLSGDDFLKFSKARVELLTDRSHLEMACFEGMFFQCFQSVSL